MSVEGSVKIIRTVLDSHESIISQRTDYVEAVNGIVTPPPYNEMPESEFVAWLKNHGYKLSTVFLYGYQGEDE